MMGNAKKIIFAVDDMPEVLTSINAVLKNDYDIRCVTDAKSALAALESVMPNLILLDMEMPGMSGLEFLETIQKNDKLKNVPVVFLTSNSETKTAQKAISKGAKGYIIKPFSPDELLKTVTFFS
ncbi:MAG: response regulator [Spirochaetaceae bacterium]|jgi:CheY-like chemotaxis protein|nr:response regulator [Spirochaetaceae bacterium]